MPSTQAKIPAARKKLFHMSSINAHPVGGMSF